MIVYIMLIISVITFTLIIDMFINNGNQKVIVKERLTDDPKIIFEDNNKN